MKVKVLFLLTSLVAGSLITNAQRGPRIGYFDMEYILENIEEYGQANTQLDSKVQKWKTEIEQQQSSIEQMRQNLSVEKVLLTKELIEEREEDILVKEKEMLQYQQDRFGPKGDLILQRIQLVKPIQDQVFNAVQEIAASKKYDYIFDKSAEGSMLFSAKKHDISDLILRRLNRDARKRNIGRKVDSSKDKFEDSTSAKDSKTITGAGKTPTSEIDARKAASNDKAAARQKLIEENRKRKLADREAKKKEFEERRKKLLAERAAARKKKEEERKKKAKEKGEDGDGE
ncbi:OmpH family outer membrane protein [Spongiivirga citrea]|uniref:OmpH family outer membrane protein n=1 Tax=Spongiivirga citrea TaxID=1481457 RepID=A0A6M0CMF2_9FLAO|nr:OmpH family outer membrane protein [Spongiivirga citrea]NER18143.1 OmpH family outer membrane protein [Spongiivirga citrea]